MTWEVATAREEAAKVTTACRHLHHAGKLGVEADPVASRNSNVDLPDKKRALGFTRITWQICLPTTGIRVLPHRLEWLTLQMLRNAGCVSERCVHRRNLRAAAAFLHCAPTF